MRRALGCVASAWLVCVFASPVLCQQLEPIPLRIPPLGIALPAEERNALEEQAKVVRRAYQQLPASPHLADADALIKAVELALLHGEFYSPQDGAKTREVLALAADRVRALKSGRHPWTKERGLVVRGYHSGIDGSPQVYGLEIPENLDFKKPVPLYVWLHGRGDKTTDVHFAHQRMKRPGRIQPAGAMVVHPFGRHCMGFKSAGEIDVLDVVAHVKTQYPIDPDRIVLMGFSMGGAGAWHIGAHYADHWVAISPGAGFAETARYNRLTPDKYPPWYEQRLWSLYDVPAYVRRLLNAPVIAYSGEVDKQIQAARVMEEAYLSQGRSLPHLIGPGVGHKYHPETLRDLLSRIDSHVAKGRVESSPSVAFQTRTLRYSKQGWVQALRLDSHWNDSRIDARRETGRIVATTKNVRAFALSGSDLRNTEIAVDGQTIPALQAQEPLKRLVLVREGNPRNGRWRVAKGEADARLEEGLAKRPGLQGPIDDAFLEPLLIVAPTGEHQHESVGKWVRFELDHLRRRWRSLYRGHPPVKNDVDVTDEDIRSKHLIVFGDPKSNSLLRRAMAAQSGLPIRWDAKAVRVGDRAYPAASHAPVMIYPNPLAPNRYLVVNSGPTHREGHDRTNSLQNPKLPDWAIVDLRTPPTEIAPGRIVEANFFDESWGLRPLDAR